tara:strand:- start:42653 stop:43396 length:744 start_codon:yes stop_codon:yes gene_type:complete
MSFLQRGGKLIRIGNISILSYLDLNKIIFDTDGDERFMDACINNIFGDMLQTYTDAYNADYVTKFCSLLKLYAGSVRPTAELSVHGAKVSVYIDDVVKNILQYKSTSFTVDIDGKSYTLSTPRDLFFKNPGDVIASIVDPYDESLPAKITTAAYSVLQTEMNDNKDIYIIKPNPQLLKEGLLFTGTNAFEFLKIIWNLNTSPDDIYTVISQLGQLGYGSVLDRLTLIDYDNIMQEQTRDSGNENNQA